MAREPGLEVLEHALSLDLIEELVTQAWVLDPGAVFGAHAVVEGARGLGGDQALVPGDEK